MTAKPPVRLLESGDLPQSERALLEAGRALPPTHYDVAAGAARFRAALDAVATGGAAGASTAATTGVTGLATIVKLGALVLMTSLGAGLGYYAWSSQRPAQVTERASVKPVVATETAARDAPPPSAAAVEVVREVAPEVEVEAERPVPVMEKERVRAVREAARVRARAAAKGAKRLAQSDSTAIDEEKAAPTATSGPVVKSEPVVKPEAREAPQPQEANDTRVVREAPDAREARVVPEPVQPIDELQGIARARGLLRSDPDQALALLQRLAREHPRGYFVEERTALTVLALAAAGKDELAAQRGKAFLRAYPSSPYADRVKDALDR